MRLFERVVIFCSFIVFFISAQIHFVSAQNDILATVYINPYPSPYFSDWETSPNIGSLTITNNSDQDKTIRIFATLTRNNNEILATGQSNSKSLPPYSTTTFDGTSDIGGDVDYNKSMEEQVIRSGRIPEGEYEACLRIEDLQQNILVDNLCASFTILYPDPPYQISPMDGDTLRTEFPVFQWTPLQVPLDYQINYVVQIAEILPGQMPLQALSSNILHFEVTDLNQDYLLYPPDGQPFESGKTYAWWVQAVDQNGFPPSSNEGRSEIWTFTYDNETTLYPVYRDLNLTITPDVASAGMLSDFETSSYESVSKRLDAYTYGGNLEIPLTYSVGFTPIHVPNVDFYLKSDPGKKSLAIRGKKTIRGNEFDAMLTAQWGSRNDPRNRALAIKGPGFKGFFPGDGPLNNLATTQGYLIFSTNDFTIQSKNLPDQVSDYYSKEEISLKPGLNYYSKIDLHLWNRLNEIAKNLGFNDQYITLKGYLGGDIKSVFSTSDGTKVDVSKEASLSANLPPWQPPQPFQKIVPEMQGEVEIGVDQDKKMNVQFKIEAGATFPFLRRANVLSDTIKFSGGIKLEKEHESLSGTDKSDKSDSTNIPAGGVPTPFKQAELLAQDTTKSSSKNTTNNKDWNYSLILSANDVFKFPALENVFNFHNPTMEYSFNDKQVKLSGAFDVGRFTNVGILEISKKFDNEISNNTSKSDTSKIPTGGVPTPFKQAELLAKDSTNSKASVGNESKKNKSGWQAKAKFDPLALRALSLPELLKALWNFSGNLDILSQIPSLNNLSIGFAPDDAGSLVLAASTSYLNSNTAILASRAKSTNNKNGILFGLKPDNWSLKKIYPDLAIPALDNMSLSNVGLIYTNQDITESSNDMTDDEYNFYQQVYQNSDFDLQLKPGLNLIAAIPIDKIGADSPLIPLLDKLGIEKGPALLQGNLAKKVKDMYLIAALPPMHPEGSPAWFKSGQLSLELTGQPSIGLVGSITVDISDDLVTFFLKTKAGKEGLILAGGLDAQDGWDSPFGLEWLILNRVILLLGITPTGSVQLGFEGDMVVGEKDIHVAVLAAINAVTGVPTNFMFDGNSDDGFGMGDLVTLQANMVAANSGNKTPNPIPLDKLPDMGIKKVKLKFAPKDSPELNIERGMTIGGLLYIQANPNTPVRNIAETLFDVGDNGIIAKGKIGAFELGPMKMNDAQIDMTLTRDVQHFLVSGETDLGFTKAALDISFTKTSAEFNTESKIFDLFETELHAEGKLSLTNPIFEVHAKLKNDFNREVEQIFNSGLTDMLAANVATAKKELDVADKALINAINAREAARRAWQNTPLFPRNKKTAARSRWVQRTKTAGKLRVAKISKAGVYTKWQALNTAVLTYKQSQGEGKFLVLERAEFEADLASLKKGEVKKMDLQMKVKGQPHQIAISGWNFKDIKKSVQIGVKQLVKSLFSAS